MENRLSPKECKLFFAFRAFCYVSKSLTGFPSGLLPCERELRIAKIGDFVKVSLMETTRLKIEESVLKASFRGAYRLVQKNSGAAELDIDVTVPGGGTYGLLLETAPDYPSSMPEAYLVRPLVLRDFHGRELLSISPSHEMHLLRPNGRFIRLCHYKSENWHPNVTLYKVVLKCMIWLVAYENHLQSGRPITDYLGR